MLYPCKKAKSTSTNMIVLTLTCPIKGDEGGENAPDQSVCCSTGTEKITKCYLVSFPNIIELQNGVIVLDLHDSPAVPSWRPQNGVRNIFTYHCVILM
jgi:hypothetical protein